MRDKKRLTFDYSDINYNDSYQNHHIVKGVGNLSLDKLSSKRKCSILISNIVNKKKLYTFRITNTAFCSFCSALAETLKYIFFDCIHLTAFLWLHSTRTWHDKNIQSLNSCYISLGKLQTEFKNDFILQSLTPQTVILRLYREANDNCNFLSHMSLILKYYIYISREKRILN